MPTMKLGGLKRGKAKPMYGQHDRATKSLWCYDGSSEDNEKMTRMNNITGEVAATISGWKTVAVAIGKKRTRKCLVVAQGWKAKVVRGEGD
ncbi:inorganic phosphate transporter [Sesbania bispinosa]|nr:inorganic phosphate transporter [Sesbania bispinosa]